jgi:short subunit dehydrogenase-like uncharacterized protein
VRLELAFMALGSMSRGTLKTMIEHLGEGAQVRRRGKIQTVPAGSLVRTIEFGGKPRQAMAIGWGDVSTAQHSTGIGDITVYMVLPPGQQRALRLMTKLGPLLRSKAVIRGLQAIVGRLVTGPGEAVRESAHAELWAQVTAVDGSAVEGRPAHARGLQDHGVDGPRLRAARARGRRGGGLSDPVVGVRGGPRSHAVGLRARGRSGASAWAGCGSGVGGME